MRYFKGSTIRLVISDKGKSFLVEMKDHLGQYKVIDRVSLGTSYFGKYDGDSLTDEDEADTGLIWNPEGSITAKAGSGK